MARKKVNFIATKYRNQKTQVKFFTKKGERVSFKAVKRVPKEEKVEFYTNN